MISIDTLRADRLGAYGYGRDTSPALDRLTETSVVFENAFSVSDKTAPSHMSIFTGLHPEAHQILMNLNWVRNRKREPTPWKLDSRIPTLAERLSERGYEARAWVGGGNVSAAYGFDRGFKQYQNTRTFKTGSYKPTTDEWAPALEWLRKPPNKPFFLFLHTYAVHDPYQPPEPYFSMFGPPYQGRIQSSSKGWLERAEYWKQVDNSDPRDIAKLSDVYDGGIRYMDDVLLRNVIATLEGLGRDKDTIVVIISDHGEEFMEHGEFAHKQLYDEILHVPFILYFPGAVYFPRRVGTQVSTLDITPTLLSLLGIEFDSALMEGRSLVPLLRDQTQDESPVHAVDMSGSIRDETHLEVHVTAQALRVGGRKLFQDPQGLRLYDVVLDPTEQVDFIDLQDELASELKRALAEQTRAHEKMRVGRGLTAVPGRYSDQTVDQLKALGYVE